MKAFYDEEAPFLSPLIPVHVYFGRMMDCMMDHVRHEMTMAMMLLSTSGRQGQLIVIRAKPAGDFDPGEYPCCFDICINSSNWTIRNLLFL